MIPKFPVPVPFHESDTWPACADCGVQYPPGWVELRWHLVHGCSGSMWGISECPGGDCLCKAPLETVQHWCEACDGEDPRTCPARLEAENARLRQIIAHLMTNPLNTWEATYWASDIDGQTGHVEIADGPGDRTTITVVPPAAPVAEEVAR